MKRFLLLALALGIACAPQKSEKEQLAEQVNKNSYTLGMATNNMHGETTH